MKLAVDAFWRAALYCLHPRVIALSILPLVIMAVITLGLGYFFWDSALAAVRSNLESFELVNTLMAWLERFGLSGLRVVLAPVIVLFLAIPVIVIVALLFVAWMMTPAMVSLVAERRFAKLERKQGGSIWGSVAWSLTSTVAAIIALAVSVPLWLIPPLILVLPPLIWGWLTYRVMAFDAMAQHASRDERRQIFKEHRGTMLGIGIISGYLGAAPSVLWASGALFIAMAPILVPFAIWIYTLVFAFSSLWFSHFVLAALADLRQITSTLTPATPAASALNTIDVVAPSPASDANADPLVLTTQSGALPPPSSQ